MGAAQSNSFFGTCDHKDGSNQTEDGSGRSRTSDGPRGGRSTEISTGPSGGRAQTNTSTTANAGTSRVYADGPPTETINTLSSGPSKRVIRQGVPTQSRGVGNSRKGNTGSFNNAVPTPVTPLEDRPTCAFCSLVLPCADGYVACCRTCKVSGGKSHGPSCQAFRPRQPAPGEEGGEDEDPDDVVSLPDKEDLRKTAQRHQMESACTAQGEGSDAFTWMSVWSTPRRRLGQFGPGVRLYFEFILWIGTTFAVIQLVCLPMIGMTAMGSFAETSMENEQHMAINSLQQTLVHLTLGNLGDCAEDSHCQTRGSRVLRSFTNNALGRVLNLGGDLKLRDVTLWYALNDCLAVVLFSISVFIFRKWRVDTVIEQVDDANVTATDYAFRVGRLPGVLGCPPSATREEKLAAAKGETHAKYAELLTEHFDTLLESLFGEDDVVEEGEIVPDRVVEVVLVREWYDAINKYQKQGDFLLAKENTKKKLALCRSKMEYERCSDESLVRGSGGVTSHKARADMAKKAAKLREQLDKTEHSIHALEDKIHETAVPTQQRPVLSAFVIVNEERFKDMLIRKYRPHNSRLTRGGLGERWKFQGSPITCTKCREPMDVMWENMDFPKRRARNARVLTSILTVIIVLSAFIGIMILRSVPLSRDLDPPANMVWSLYNSTSCWELSGLTFYSDSLCTQELTGYECVDPDGATLSDVACQSTLAAFESASCPGATGAAYGVAVKFSAETHVNCIAATLGPATTADFIQFEACDDRFEGADLKNSEWQVTGRHTLLRPMVLPEGRYDAQGEKISGTGGETMVVQRISDLETTCSRFDDTLADVEEVKAKVNSLYAKGTEKAFYPRLACYCDAKRLESDPDWPWRTVAEDPSPDHEVCKEWLDVYRSKIWQTGAASVVVVFANQILKAIFHVIDRINVYKSRTQLQTGSMRNLCFAQVLVTGLMVFMASQNFRETLDKLNLRPKGEYYDDFTVGWYLSVAAGYYPVLASQAASCLCILIAMKFVLGPFGRWFKQRNVYVQVILNEANDFAEWNVSGRFAESLTIIFCTMLFSSMMPVVYTIGACYCFVAYWVDKWKLLRDCMRPPNYDDRMVMFAIKVCRIAVLTHLVIAMYAFGCQDVFPTDWGPSWATKFMQGLTGISEARYDEIMLVHESSGHEDYQRARLNDLARWGCLPSFVLFIPLFVYYASMVLSLIFRPCIKICGTVRHITRKRASEALGVDTNASGRIFSSSLDILHIKRSDATKETFMEAMASESLDSVQSKLEKLRQEGGGVFPGIWMEPAAGATSGRDPEEPTNSCPTTKHGHLMSYDIRWHPKYARAFQALAAAGEDSGAYRQRSSEISRSDSTTHGSGSPHAAGSPQAAARPHAAERFVV